MPLAAFSGLFTYAFIYGIVSGRKIADTAVGIFFHCLAGAIFESLLLFSVLGLIWSVATPTWIEKLFQKAAQKLVLLLALLCLLGLPFALWALCKA